MATDRKAALALLANLGVTNDLTEAKTEAPAVKATGAEVYAGGDVPRLLVLDAHLTYRSADGKELLHAFATPGDTILVTQEQADRLDSLKVTSDAGDQDEEEDQGEEEPSPENDEAAEKFRSMGAEELVAHANQHPEDHATILALELERPQSQRRVTVLKAANPNGDDPDEELD